MESVCTNRDTCTGCCLCASICPKSAIKMVLDDEGFLRPNINNEFCVNCGLCASKCITNNAHFFFDPPSKYFYAKSKNSNLRKAGSSGGIFPELATSLIKEGWLISGAAFDENFQLKHQVIDKYSDLAPLFKSKYIQSDSTQAYVQIKKKIENGQKVFFVGTPCQLAALHTFCGRHDNLFTADLICHGVGSSKYFYDYIKTLQKRKNSQLLFFDFRSKKYGTLNYAIEALFRNGKKFCSLSCFDEFGLPFSKSLILRKSCIFCPFSIKKRLGDITLADYHSARGYLVKQRELKKGVSLISVNSNRGLEIINAFLNLEMIEVPSSAFSENNIRVKSNEQLLASRNEFLSEYFDKGFEHVAKRFCTIKKYDVFRMKHIYLYNQIKRLFKYEK